jgi:hypothetical protein
MRRSALLLASALALLPLLSTPKAAELDKLNVLYIGDTGTPRATHCEEFLRKNVGHVGMISRRTFQPAEANEADVVLLDWPQSSSARGERQGGAPLGDRGDWTKPTVLLGSAGLNLAVAWKVRGGSG